MRLNNKFWTCRIALTGGGSDSWIACWRWRRGVVCCFLGISSSYVVVNDRRDKNGEESDGCVGDVFEATVCHTPRVFSNERRGMIPVVFELAGS